MHVGAGDAGTSDVPERSHKVLPLGEKVKVLSKERKKSCGEEPIFYP